MITLIVPTFNRAYALDLVLPTFYNLRSINEIIFIDDASLDKTEDVVSHFSEKFKHIINTVYLRNEKNMGASYGRQLGVKHATNEYILFCDDDEFMEINYAEVCLAKHKAGLGAIISGRHFYRNQNEDIGKAIERFKNGFENRNVFGKIRFKIYTDAVFTGDIYLPFTHGIFFTTKKLIDQFGIDPYYSKGNGFREESDFQVNAFVNGHKILMTNETHCVHMNMKEVRSGGQRVNRLIRFYWTIYYTHYFLKKYYSSLRVRLDLKYNLSIAMVLYIFSEFYIFFIRPFFVLFSNIGSR